MLTRLLARFLARDHGFVCALRRWLPAVAVTVALVTLTIEGVVRSDVVAEWAFAHTGIAEQVPQVAVYHRQVMDFYYADQALPRDGVWTTREIEHLVDVKRLLDANRWLAVGSLLVVLLAMIADARERWWILRRGAILLAAALTTLLWWGSVWSLFSRAMHPLAFPQGNWDFIKGRHIVIAVYDQPILTAYAVAIVFGILLGGLACWAVGWWRSGGGLYWDWQMPRWTRWLVLGTLLWGPAWLSGWWIVDPFDVGHGLYYLCSSALAVALFALWTRSNKAPAVAVLLLVGSIWWAQACGVRAAVQAARADMRAGQPIVEAVLTFQRRFGRLPTTLGELRRVGLTTLPALRSGRGGWYLRQGHGRFSVGFKGPLGYHHRYISHQQRWNGLRWTAIF